MLHCIVRCWLSSRRGCESQSSWHTVSGFRDKTLDQRLLPLQPWTSSRQVPGYDGSRRGGLQYGIAGSEELLGRLKGVRRAGQSATKWRLTVMNSSEVAVCVDDCCRRSLVYNCSRRIRIARLSQNGIRQRDTLVWGRYFMSRDGTWMHLGSSEMGMRIGDII